MPYLNEIVEVIDATILESSLNNPRFQKRFFAGLVQQVAARINEDRIVWVPGKVTTLSEIQLIAPDDSYPLMTYHRIVASGYEQAPDRSQFGDSNEVIISNTDILLTVIAFTEPLKLTVDQLEALFIAGFPSQIQRSIVQDLQMISVTTTVVSSNFDSFQIFASEFRGEQYFLKTGIVMFQIRYRIRSTFKKGCFKICDDC